MFKISAVALALSAVAFSASAMTSIEDGDLSQFTGEDGVSIAGVFAQTIDVVANAAMKVSTSLVMAQYDAAASGANAQRSTTSWARRTWFGLPSPRLV